MENNITEPARNLKPKRNLKSTLAPLPAPNFNVASKREGWPVLKLTCFTQALPEA